MSSGGASRRAGACGAGVPRDDAGLAVFDAAVDPRGAPRPSASGGAPATGAPRSPSPEPSATGPDGGALDPGGPAGTSGGSIGCTVYDGRGGGGSAALAALASTAGVSARDRIMIITAIEPSSAAPAITTYSGHAARGAACSGASGPGSTASGPDGVTSTPDGV